MRGVGHLSNDNVYAMKWSILTNMNIKSFDSNERKNLCPVHGNIMEIMVYIPWLSQMFFSGWLLNFYSFFPV